MNSDTAPSVHSSPPTSPPPLPEPNPFDLPPVISPASESSDDETSQTSQYDTRSRIFRRDSQSSCPAWFDESAAVDDGKNSVIASSAAPSLNESEEDMDYDARFDDSDLDSDTPMAPDLDGPALEDMSVHLFRVLPLRTVVWTILSVVSLVLLPLLNKWFPLLWLRTVCSKVHSVERIGRYFAHVEVSDNESATHIVPVERVKFGHTANSIFPDCESDILTEIVKFEVLHQSIVLHPTQGWLNIRLWKDPSWSYMASKHNASEAPGLSKSIRALRSQIFAQNMIDIPTPSISSLLLNELFNPFYVFQIVSIFLWSYDNYASYASCIAFISAIGIINTLVETRQTIAKLRELSRFSCAVQAKVEGNWCLMKSEQLIPGDIICVENVEVVPCDAILITGEAIVNEAMLTGESIPAPKLAASASQLAMYAQRSSSLETLSTEVSGSFLYAGTSVMRARTTIPGQRAQALVVRTGFNTTKGALIRSMLFPKMLDLRFYRDSMRFIGVLAVFAALGFMFSIVKFLEFGTPWTSILIRAADLVTVVVPPALPATMAIGTSFAVRRLRKKGVMCIAPRSINVGGRVNVCCFDKTGTLTEDGLQVLGVRCLDDSRQYFADLLESVEGLANTSTHTQSAPISLIQALATCHGIRSLDHGQIVGDPLDTEMLKFTGWSIRDPNSMLKSESAEYDGVFGDKIINLVSPLPMMLPSDLKTEESKVLAVVRSFEFQSSLRRMSVIVKSACVSGISVYCKGAPEVMKECCIAESFPQDYEELLTYYTRRGYRVIACAGKHLQKLSIKSAQTLTRLEAEKNMTFLGLLIFENRLKPGSLLAMNQIRKARLAVRMVTGDNPRTAISVARECELISNPGHVFLASFASGACTDPEATLEWSSTDDKSLQLDAGSLRPVETYEDHYANFETEYADYHLAVTGDVFRWLLDFASRDLLDKILIQTQIYARMAPAEKCELILRLQNLGYTVSMTGDGANDAPAMKAADIAISLSEAECSIAAPFTSNTGDIQCFLDVMREGRASLVTSFGCFKFMALYSIVQFCTITLLYNFMSNLADYQFLYIDLIITLPLAMTMARTQAYPKLHVKRPATDLVSPKVLSSIFGQMIIMIVFQLGVFFWIRTQSFYTTPAIDKEEFGTFNYENTALFLLSSFQYIFGSIVFSVGPPYRLALYTNPLFLGTILTLLFINCHVLFHPASDLASLLSIKHTPAAFRFKLSCLIAFNAAISVWFEAYGEARLSIFISWLKDRWKLFRRQAGGVSKSNALDHSIETA